MKKIKSETMGVSRRLRTGVWLYRLILVPAVLWMTALMAVTFTLTGMAQNIVKDYDNGNNNNNNDYVEDRIKIDRYLTVEIWPNHTDGEYYINDNVVLNFLTNHIILPMSIR